MAERLAGKTALITGGARGIGLCIARAMSREGARVALADLDLDAARESAADIADDALALELDLRDVASCRACVRAAIASLGRLDILVNNGGICKTVPIDQIDQEFYDNMFDTNVRGAFFCSQSAAAHMRERATGRIINIASIAARTGGSEDVSVYAATKGALHTLTKAFAKYLAPGGTANTILPGPTGTDMLLGWSTPEQIGSLTSKILLGRLADPEDHAGAAVFLASDEASYITGAGIDTNGGMLMP
jgi:NAD(P)-dependent dehydrogenase (short-subunit alcohol dehydrogenase family)